MGSYSGIKSVFIKQEIVNGEVVHTRTFEHTVTGHFLPFSLRGDSGSFVFDSEYNVVGLIFGGNEDRTYLTSPMSPISSTVLNR